MKNVLLILGIIFFFTPAFGQEESPITPKLEALAVKIVDVFATGNKSAYMDILHPECPAPISQKLAYDLSKKWLPEEGDFRVAKLVDRYDPTQLRFFVEPTENVLEFQYQTVRPEGTKMELITSYPVAVHEGQLKILDFPCFEPKR